MINTNQSQFFTLMKESLSGNSLAQWEGGKPYCNFTGVGCDDQGYVVKIDVTGWLLSGHFPPDSFNMSRLNQPGTLPDFSPLKFLRILDMSTNNYTGNFPVSITNLSNLEVLNFNENDGFNLWQLPENISRLTKLKSMVLATCMVTGPIPATIGDMTSLVDLELSGNYLSGPIPREIGLLKNLRLLELYYNQLAGNIPEEIGNLTELRDLDVSVNRLTGKIPESICRLPNLQVLQFYNNSLSGEIPGVIANSTTLNTLSLYDNFLTGVIPNNLGQFSSMVLLELSENRLSGPLPPYICEGVSNNRLEGSIPEGLLNLPHVSIIDLSNNNFTGPLANTIENPRNLSELFIQGNRISGVIPPSISRATNLVKIDLSYNLLSGPIPSEIGYLRKINLLLLQGNKLSSSIPSSLSSLRSLNVLDLSNNLLTGRGLVESFSGNPGLCVSVNVNSSDKNFRICPQPYNRKKINSIWVIGISVALIVLGAVLFLKRRFSQQRAAIEHDESMSSSFFSYEVKSFHRISFDQREVIEAMVDKNIVGHGGSGTVYKIELSSGDVVAVKRLWSRKIKDTASEDQLFLDKELKTEVETLGSIRHINIVKLYCCFSSLDCSLLVYEYMPNGNLWDALHKGWTLLDWPTRHQIALGIAQGLAYLHHDLLRPIIHRDIKSTNILLDRDYQPKVADFGIAKVLQARGGKESTTTVIAGTYGYLAPEYAYSSKATTKCDVYSFGVVLMELITGKKPVEPEFGESKNITYWVSNKVDTKEGAMEVLDNRLSGSFKDEMIQVLRIAIRFHNKIYGGGLMDREVTKRIRMEGHLSHRLFELCFLRSLLKQETVQLRFRLACAGVVVGLAISARNGLGLGLGLRFEVFNAGVVVVSWGCDLGVVVAWGCDLGVVGAWACRSRRGGASDLADLADLGLGLPISASACLLSSSSFPA
uniref:Protein kinase domain-containing protein n=1 Tax=Fagus sylvatica TaxID=28930 RepID=A0A2N9HUL0_FAGSY